MLKTFCQILVLERSGTKETLLDRIMGYLCCPTNDGKEVKAKASKKTPAPKGRCHKELSSCDNFCTKGRQLFVLGIVTGSATELSSFLRMGTPRLGFQRESIVYLK